MLINACQRVGLLSFCACLLQAMPVYAQNQTVTDDSQSTVVKYNTQLKRAEVKPSVEEPQTPEEQQQSRTQESLKKVKQNELGLIESSQDAQLDRDIQTQHQLLIEAQQSEDAFSLKLAEQYLSYGLLLQKAGRLSESNKALGNALHIQKVNYGIYSIEQRQLLKRLFNNHFTLGNQQEFESYLRRLVWLENQHPDLKDDFSFDLLIKAGHYFLDEVVKNPIFNESNLALIRTARQYFNYAINNYNDYSLEEVKLPYGELALVNILEGRALVNMNRSTKTERSRKRRSAFNQPNRGVQTSKSLNSFALNTRLFAAQLEKAKSENNTRQVVQALLGLADTNLMFFRHSSMRKYYKKAWLHAQLLDENDPLRQSFNQPVAFPAFNFILPRVNSTSFFPHATVPMSISINEKGSVSDVLSMAGSEIKPVYVRKAKREVSKRLFRPAIINGEPVVTQQFSYPVLVKIRKKRQKPQQQAENTTKPEQLSEEL